MGHDVASAVLYAGFAVASGFMKLGDGMYFVDAPVFAPGVRELHIARILSMMIVFRKVLQLRCLY